MVYGAAAGSRVSSLERYLAERLSKVVPNLALSPLRKYVHRACDFNAGTVSLSEAAIVHGAKRSSCSNLLVLC